MPKKSNKHLFTIIGGLLLYLVSTGVSYAVFGYLNQPASISSPVGEEKKSGFKVDITGPKTEACPLNGALFTKEEKKIWEERRPLAVMIENHADSRPQSGLSRADVVYEAVAEGGITRFLAIYYCDAVKEEVNLAPVRSSRIYFINWAQEYGDKPMYVHVGGANNFSGSGDTAKDVRALEYLQELGWRVRGGNDLDPTYDGQFPVFWRDYERLGKPAATEHTMVSSTEKIWEEAHKRGLDAIDKKEVKWSQSFIPWQFKEEAIQDKRGNVGSLTFDFWLNAPDYTVKWQYNQSDNFYLRFNGSQPQQDHNNNEQIRAKVVVVQFVKERGPVDANKHIFYTTTGEGKIIVFQDGEKTEGTWKKDKPASRTKFFDSKGKEILLNRGPIWIEILPIGREVSY